MSNLRTMFLATLLLLPASRACADNRELYQADVCNKGQITVDVAIAYKDLAFNEVWMIERWWHVRPRECKPVWRQFYAPNNVLNFRSFPLHLAFAFTDSTGVWGAAKVPPPRNIAASHLQLCVSTGDQKYKVDAKDPAAACKGQREAFLIPASIDWEPTNGTTCCQWGDYGPPMKFDVALGPSDRAIPLGPRATPGALASGPGTFTDLDPILTDAVRGPGAPKPQISARDYPITNFWLTVCVPPPVVKTASWADPQSARSQAIKASIRQFMATHRFRDAEGVVDETLGHGAPGQVSRKIRITETAGRFGVEEVTACSHDSYVDMRVPAAEQAPNAPAPAAKPAPQAAKDSEPGFGDLLGPGGFVKPPSR